MKTQKSRKDEFEDDFKDEFDELEANNDDFDKFDDGYE